MGTKVSFPLYIDAPTNQYVDGACQATAALQARHYPLLRIAEDGASPARDS